jgi:hypothetical protein
MAVEKILEEGLQELGAAEGFFDFDEFALGEFFPAGADGGIVSQTREEDSNLGEGETHFGCETDQQDAMDGVGWIAALAADALWQGEKADLFVVADGGGVEVCGGGELPDFHDWFPSLSETQTRKKRRSFLQGLNPVLWRTVSLGLKPRPPKEKAFVRRM